MNHMILGLLKQPRTRSFWLTLPRLYATARVIPTNKEVYLGRFVEVLRDRYPLDVELKAWDSDKKDPICAHKLLLSARSEVFENMFEFDEYGSNKPSSRTVPFLKHEELEALVEFFYSDASILPEEAKQHVRTLYIAADKYKIPHLKDVCRDQLKSSLNSTNALDILVLAQNPFDEFLNDAALNTIKATKHEIANSDEFGKFVVSHPLLTVEIMKAISADAPNYRGDGCGCWSQEGSNESDEEGSDDFYPLRPRRSRDSQRFQ